MSVSPSFRTFALEQLGRSVRRLRDKRMFGGVGIYAGDLFFALIADDALYFKIDDSNRRDYTARGMGPLHPYGDAVESMNYYQVPEDLLDDPEELGVWAAKAIEVARRAKTGKKRRKPSQ